SLLSFFFFFQAEDGIRDRNVTGVQTCALPISFSFEKSTFAFPSFDTAYHSPAYLSDGLQAVNNKNIPSKITICLNVIRIPTSFQSYLIFNTATLTSSP